MIQIKLPPTNWGRFKSGLIANVGGSAVGLTNTFGYSKGISECVRRACLWADGLPVVGYGSGTEVSMMKALGFEVMGTLRVWVR